jgi:Flp pilus assembly pilin Flp
MSHLLLRFQYCRKASTAIEYAFIAAIVSLSIVLALRHVGDATTGLYGYVMNNIVAALASTPDAE